VGVLVFLIVSNPRFSKNVEPRGGEEGGEGWVDPDTACLLLRRRGPFSTHVGRRKKGRGSELLALSTTFSGLGPGPARGKGKKERVYVHRKSTNSSSSAFSLPLIGRGKKKKRKKEQEK